MKTITYLLLLFVGFGQSLRAQTEKVEPLELRYMYLFPLSANPGFFSRALKCPEWFQAQKALWEVELKKDKRNERAWENYLFACQVVRVEEKDSLQGLRLEKELRGLEKKMKKSIPNSRYYYQYLQSQTTDQSERDALQRKIALLKRTTERDYLADMDYYYSNRQMDQLKALAREWYESGLFSSNLLFYCYNELVGLKENAILVADMSLGTYYWCLLQYGVGLFKDVEIIESTNLMDPTANGEFWKRRGVDVKTLPEWDYQKMPFPGVWYLEQKENRPVYFTQMFGSKYIFNSLKDKLYSEGLVFRYSSKPYNNMAVLRKNYEQNYLLDYIRHPLLTYRHFLSDEISLQRNYVVGLAPLLQFYKTSGDKNQYQRLRHFLQGIIDGLGKNQPLASEDVLESRKLMEAALACVEKVKEYKYTIVYDTDSDSLRDQLQKLIDPEKP